VVSVKGRGWGGLTFGPGGATYDATSGLTVPMTASGWDGQSFASVPMEVIINQSTGRVESR
jgi:hypothetical protein